MSKDGPPIEGIAIIGMAIIIAIHILDIEFPSISKSTYMALTHVMIHLGFIVLALVVWYVCISILYMEWKYRPRKSIDEEV